MNSGVPGRLVIVSGPSGAGKSTVLRRVLQEAPVPLVASVSATTRPPRPGEVDGVDYRFLTPQQFENYRASDGFIECFSVFGKGHWYGTLRSEVEPRLAAGRWVLLEIDVQGARQVIKQYPDAITIFLRTRSMEELESRLRGRNTETESHVQQRLKQARSEMAASDEYEYQVVNDEIPQAVREICDILERLKNNSHNPN